MEMFIFSLFFFVVYLFLACFCCYCLFFFLGGGLQAGVIEWDLC